MSIYGIYAIGSLLAYNYMHIVDNKDRVSPLESTLWLLLCPFLRGGFLFSNNNIRQTMQNVSSFRWTGLKYFRPWLAVNVRGLIATCFQDVWNNQQQIVMISTLGYVFDSSLHQKELPKTIKQTSKRSQLILPKNKFEFPREFLWDFLREFFNLHSEIFNYNWSWAHNLWLKYIWPAEHRSDWCKHTCCKHRTAFHSDCSVYIPTDVLRTLLPIKTIWQWETGVHMVYIIPLRQRCEYPYPVQNVWAWS